MKYSIIIPCYKSSQTIGKVVKLTAEELKNLGIEEFEFVLVNDCSPDERATANELARLYNEYDFVKAVDLAKNAGQHNAIIAGLNYATGDACIAMDDDMQTHPSQLKFLIEEFNKGYDIVYGYYPEKKHSWFRNLGSRLNHLSVRLLIGKPKDLKTSSFWIIRKYVRDCVIQYKNSYTYLQGLFLRTTRNISSVPITHFEREVGTSNYTLRRLIHLWSSIIGFSVLPLRLAVYLGFMFSGIGVLGAIVVLVKKLLNPAMVAGWSSMMFAQFFFSGLILAFMGLVGEYVGRLYLSANNEPQYIVRELLDRDSKKEK